MFSCKSFGNNRLLRKVKRNAVLLSDWIEPLEFTEWFPTVPDSTFSAREHVSESSAPLHV